MIPVQIHTRQNRNQAITTVKDGVMATQGWIVHHELFSNKAATILAELPAQQVPVFIEYLTDHGLQADKIQVPTRHKGGECRLSVSLTFLHDDPDMKRDVIAFG